MNNLSIIAYLFTFASIEKVRFLSETDLSLSKNLYRTACKIERGGVYVALAAIFMEENPVLRKKNRNLADFTTGIRRIQVKSGGGGSGGGACSPVHLSVKNTFLTDRAPAQ